MNQDEGVARPYRLWDSRAKAWVPYRYYSVLENAHMGAQRELRWKSPPGRTIELMNYNSNRVILTYIRHVDGIKWR